MRRVAATLVGLALLVAGCASSSTSAAPTPTPTGTASAAAVVAPVDWTTGVPTVSGSYGDKPTLTYTGSAPTALSRKVLIAGTGPAVKQNDLVVADYLGQVWDGKVFDNSYDKGAVASFQLVKDKIIPGWIGGLTGVKAGSRIVLSIPPDQGYGAAGNSSAGITATDTLVFVIDVVSSYSGDAGAGAKTTPGSAAPAGIVVTGVPGSRSTVKVTAGTAKPTKPVLTVLAKGTGAPLSANLAVLQYEAVDWTSAIVGSTWASGAPEGAPIDKTQKSSPFDVLYGLPIGTRALLQIPATSGRGPYAVVVDIVGQATTAKQAAKG